MGTNIPFNFNPDDKLVIQLRSDEIIEALYVDGSENHIRLRQITSNYTTNVIPGPQYFYRLEIVSINTLSEDLGNLTPNQIRRIQLAEPLLILVDENRYFQMKTSTHQYTYLTTLDARYYKAMKDIKNYSAIGLAAITMSLEKHAFLSLIIFSTRDHVWILDIWLLGAKRFPPELKEIIESETVVKVMHDSRLFTEILKDRFKMKVVNLFDTKAVDVMIRKREGELPNTVKTLQEALTTYLNLPSKILAPEELPLWQWRKRPLPDKMKFKAAQKVAYLVTLMEIMRMRWLNRLYDSFDAFNQSSSKCCGQDVVEI